MMAHQDCPLTSLDFDNLTTGRETMRDFCDGSGQPRIVYVLTASLAVRFLRGQLRYLREAGFDVTVIASWGEELATIPEAEGVRAISVPFSRGISLRKDLMSLWHLWRVMRRIRPTITSVGTPKAGLLGGLVAFFAGVPCRLYTLRGLRLQTVTGMRRRVLLFAERLACLSAHRIICVSNSLRQEAVALGLADSQKTVVLGSGSSNGVDVSRFDLDQAERQKAVELRSKLGIPPDAPVVGFVGRFTRDKGIDELLQAFSLLRERLPELRVLLVGDVEKGDLPSLDVLQKVKTDPNIVCPGFVADPALYYQIMDVLALPTRREGFPNAVLEANASGKPAVVTNATGAVDSVIDGVTGFIVPVGDSVALANALAKLLYDPCLAKSMGQTARDRAAAEFRQETIWAGMLGECRRLLVAKALPLPLAEAQARESVPTPEGGFAQSCIESSND
jgi:glycosyltransferase involved in cell wall biosynthesis